MWRVHVESDYRFAFDQLQVVIAKRDDNGDMAYIKPLSFEVDPVFVVPTGVFVGLPEQITTLMPRELAEAIFDEMGKYLLHTDHPFREIQRLRRELDYANRRVDSLIAGIGRMGGEH